MENSSVDRMSKKLTQFKDEFVEEMGLMGDRLEKKIQDEMSKTREMWAEQDRELDNLRIRESDYSKLKVFVGRAGYWLKFMMGGR